MEVSGPNARVVVGGAVCAECDGFGGDGMVGDVGVDDDITRHGGTVSLGATSIVDSVAAPRGVGVRQGGRGPVGRSSEQTVETSGCASVAVDVAAAAGTAGEQSG